MTVQLALRKHDTRLMARFIQYWTGSIYSHCELVVDGLCYSSSVMDGGVRRKLAGEGEGRISLDTDKWDLIDLPWADGEAIAAYFEATDHHRYGWPSLILSQLLNLNRPVKGAQFCSEWCAAALGLPATSSLSPPTLGDWCIYIGRVGVTA